MITVVILLLVITVLQRFLPRFSVYRPVTVTMIFLAIVLVGIIGLSNLPRELFPPITYPQLTVATSYANAAPEEIETLITKIIEEAISTVKNLKEINSVSKEGISLVTASFSWGTNMDLAALNMREKIDLVKEMLPRDAEDPVVLKFNPYALPVAVLSVTGELSSEELLKISQKIIKDKLEKLEGVASASITGGREREIQVEVDQAQLKSAHIDLLIVTEALKNANLNYPAGTTKEKFYEYLIRTMGEYQTVGEIPETPVGLYDVEEEERKEREEKRTYYKEQESRLAHKKRLILLKDVAVVKDTFKEPTSFSRFNGKDNISISIQKQADANTIKTVDLAKKELRNIRHLLPRGVHVQVIYDQSAFIKGAIGTVSNAAWQGGILAFLVLFFFLRNIRASLIVALSIPFSILATFFMMFFQGLSLNMMSLGGLALGIGMLVDNAIVAVENIYRHQTMGKDRAAAAIIGTEQVAGPIIASTLTTVAVFLPMIFLAGLAGQIFRDLSYTITFSLTASMFIALTLIPLLTSRSSVTPVADGEKPIRKVRFNFIPFLVRWNEKILSLFMKFKIMGLSIVTLAFLGSLLLFQTLDRELLPKVDTGQFTLKLGLPTGTKLETTEAVTKRIESHLLKQPEVESVADSGGSGRRTGVEAVLETMGSNQSQIIINLKKKRDITTQQFVQRLKEDIDNMGITRLKVDYLLQESIYATGVELSAPIIVRVHGTDLDKLINLAEKVKLAISKIQGIYGLKDTIPSRSPERKIVVNKDKASVYGINVRDVAQTALIAIKGLVATKFKEAGYEYDITVRLSPKDRTTTSLKGIQINSTQGFSVPLDELAKLTRGLGPSEIKRYDQQRVVFITANIFGTGLKAVSDKVTDVIDIVEKPEGYEIRISGETEEAKKSFTNLIFILGLAFTLVYMIMASQFESIWQPFIIMFTVPFSIIGVSIALFVTHTSLNIAAILGIIILGGVVVNNAIVLIEYLNQARAEGKELVEAAIESSKIRLRPILMTALTTILGLTPMAISKGEGSEISSPLAITVMGGLILATILTLWIIPVLYVIAAKLLDKFKKLPKVT